MQLVVGRVVRPHGRSGELVVDVRTDVPGERFAQGSMLATEPAEYGPLTVAATRWHSGKLLVSFAHVGDRAAAEQLRGVLLVVDSADLGPLDDPEQFHDHDLIGLAVQTVSGQAVGTLVDVLHHGQDLLVVRRGDGNDVYVPFVRALVPEVDLARGRLVLDPPTGLLDPTEAE